MLGGLEVNDGLGDIVLFQRPPRQPKCVAGNNQWRVVLVETEIDTPDHGCGECGRGDVLLILSKRLGCPRQLALDYVEIGNCLCDDSFRVDDMNARHLEGTARAARIGANVSVCNKPSNKGMDDS